MAGRSTSAESQNPAMLCRMRFLMVPLLLVALTGCASSAARVDRPTVPETLAPAAEAETSRTAVEWADYDPSVKTRIDELGFAGDCSGLQGEFDIAEANSPLTQERTGHGNSVLMGYILEALSLANCY
ncbi:hypothetical protein QMG83_15260 [Salinibacterium sp. G-O1]|uniref:hypothetical protein n=1 Tax=Salinibacterium sp. G-O1 TaxID=3046208 RepID=UPI0024BABE5B|nr:hypothetical protein [Salinibacterium sp. G-O1]MDJ0336586.1 hypothetical protein [Salinibacterium sp. G-O1]